MLLPKAPDSLQRVWSTPSSSPAPPETGPRLQRHNLCTQPSPTPPAPGSHLPCPAPPSPRGCPSACPHHTGAIRRRRPGPARSSSGYFPSGPAQACPTPLGSSRSTSGLANTARGYFPHRAPPGPVDPPRSPARASPPPPGSFPRSPSGPVLPPRPSPGSFPSTPGPIPPSPGRALPSRRRRA